MMGTNQSTLTKKLCFLTGYFERYADCKDYSYCSDGLADLLGFRLHGKSLGRTKKY